jgi:phosphatidylglycerophosphatase A
MFLLPVTLPWAMAGFAAFRLFDIWKPWPIHGLQRLKGGWGVMIDDLLAGAYACALLARGGVCAGATWES